MTDHRLELAGAIAFAMAVVHGFACGTFKRLSHRYPHGTPVAKALHFLGEVDGAFTVWAALLLLIMCALAGPSAVTDYVSGLSFIEPAFVLAIMIVSATRPVIQAARSLMLGFARVLPIGHETASFIAFLTIGPLLGSFITEPAAMTVTALLLKDHFYLRKLSARFKYVTLGTLFVNVSIGGVLTPYAAPPVLMVAGKWGWDFTFMLTHFGWKAALAVLVNTALAAWVLGKELRGLAPPEAADRPGHVPHALVAVHLAFLAAVVVNAHHPAIFLPLTAVFLVLHLVTRRHQAKLSLAPAIGVAAFLADLVILGGLQSWWLAPLLTKLGTAQLFAGATALTAFTDNAALTYLGAQVPGLAAAAKYALVAGAVAGGGLTVIANAPNPAGFALLQKQFDHGVIRPALLAAAALVPTLVAMLCLGVL